MLENISVIKVLRIGSFILLMSISMGFIRDIGILLLVIVLSWLEVWIRLVLLSMSFHQALTIDWATNNPNKFQFCTPNHVWSAMSRRWEVEPTSQRIVQDILDLPRV